MLSNKRSGELDWYNRYARHIALDEVGEEGQEALNRARVMLIGGGGLGSPAALYMAAAGVGTLGLVDYDTVSLNNLQRQILHHTSDVGRPKIESAQDRIQGINPEVNLRTFSHRVDQDSIEDLLAGYELVVDGSDNFPTRFLVNDFCVQNKIPLVFGAVLQFSGQVTVFTQEEDCGCYRCLFPEAPDPRHAPTCEEAGIFGVITGIIGTLQAGEALKLVLNQAGHFIGPTLKNRLLLYDGRDTSFKSIRLKKNPHCPVCTQPDFDYRAVAYQETCAVATKPAS